MIADLKPYDEYKDSGLPWLGRVPAHWETKRAKSVLFAIDKRSEAGQEELLTVSSAHGVIPRNSANVTMFKAKTYAGHKLCWPDDLVINSLWAWGGGLGVSSRHGIVSTAYGVYRIRRDADYEPLFLHRLVRSTPFNWELVHRSKGIWKSRLQLTDSSFLNAPIPILPLDEQELIVRFLDWASVCLEKAIRAKRRVIALLEEQKQAIIHCAVTRGLDDTVLFKPSGLDWLGEVPEHWEMRRAKYLFREIDERSMTGDEELLSVSHITGVTPRSQKNITMFKARSYVGHKICRQSDLVINTMWAWMAALGVSEHTGIVSPAYAVYRPRTELLTDGYVDRLLRVSAYRAEFLARSTGIRLSRMRLYPEAFFRIPLPIPPIKEQDEIVSEIRGKTKHLDAGIENANREIELLLEYRTRLISDVVTGKLDVRDVARSLPNESERSESIDMQPADSDLDDFADDELAEEAV